MIHGIILINMGYRNKQSIKFSNVAKRHQKSTAIVTCIVMETSSSSYSQDSKAANPPCASMRASYNDIPRHSRHPHVTYLIMLQMDGLTPYLICFTPAMIMYVEWFNKTTPNLMVQIFWNDQEKPQKMKTLVKKERRGQSQPCTSPNIPKAGNSRKMWKFYLRIQNLMLSFQIFDTKRRFMYWKSKMQREGWRITIALKSMMITSRWRSQNEPPNTHCQGVKKRPCWVLVSKEDLDFFFLLLSVFYFLFLF